jgi:CBS domain containing-hemolysin-like protein
MAPPHAHAIVVSASGVTAGLATIEDVIEELLGRSSRTVRRERRASTRGRAHPPRGSPAGYPRGAVRFALPRDEAETIAGHLILRFGRIPRKGERWKGRFADFVIEQATPTAVQKIRMVLPPPVQAPPEKREHA